MPYTPGGPSSATPDIDPPRAGRFQQKPLEIIKEARSGGTRLVRAARHREQRFEMALDYAIIGADRR
jgi:hypothetical protein